MAISQIVLLVLSVGLTAQLIYQFTLQREKPALGQALAFANLLIVTVSLIGNESGILPSLGPPPKFDIEGDGEISAQSINFCLSTVSLQQPFSAAVTPHSSGGFAIEIVGRDLMLSEERTGLWERVAFFLDREALDGSTRIQFVGLQGQSTLSNSEEIPPFGERWEPFDSQAMARYAQRMDGVFTALTSCLRSNFLEEA